MKPGGNNLENSHGSMKPWAKLIVISHDIDAGPLLYHQFENIVIFRSGNLYSLCSQGNQDYQKIIYFSIFHQKRLEIDDQSSITKTI